MSLGNVQVAVFVPDQTTLPAARAIGPVPKPASRLVATVPRRTSKPPVQPVFSELLIESVPESWLRFETVLTLSTVSRPEPVTPPVRVTLRAAVVRTAEALSRRLTVEAARSETAPE